MLRLVILTLCYLLAYGWFSPLKAFNAQTTTFLGRNLQKGRESVPLFALPSMSSSFQPWRVQRKWLPLQRKPMSVFSLLASTMPLLKAGRRSADYHRYLPLESTLRITKALLRQSKHTLPEALASNAVQYAVPAAAKSARVIFMDFVLKLAVSFQVINRKIFDSFRLSGTVVSRTAPGLGITVAVDDAKTWAARKIVELSAPSPTLTPAAAEVVELPAAAEVVELPAVGLMPVLKTCYAPWTVKHMAMLASVRASMAEESGLICPEVTSGTSAPRRRLYWPQRYW